MYLRFDGKTCHVRREIDKAVSISDLVDQFISNSKCVFYLCTTEGEKLGVFWDLHATKSRKLQYVTL